MKKELRDLERARSKYDQALERANKRLQSICSFPSSITWLEGDGHAVLNEETTSAAVITCLKKKSTRKKLTEEEHSKHTF